MHARGGLIISVTAITLLIGGCKSLSSADMPVLTALAEMAEQGTVAHVDSLPHPSGGSDQPKESLAVPFASAPVPVTEGTPAQPLTLENAIALTFLANPDLQSAEAHEKVAEAALARARADFFPTLALNEGYQVSDNLLRRFEFLLSQGATGVLQGSTIPAAADNFQSELHLSWDVYHGGLRLARTRAAAADSKASKFALVAVQQRLVYKVAEAYYHLYQAIALRAVRRESVEQAESQLRDMKSRIRAGTATQADLFQAESYLTETQVALITATSQVRLSWALLENLVGAHLAGFVMPTALPPPPWADHGALVDRAVAQSEPNGREANSNDTEVEESVASALRDRPEVGETESRRQAAEYRIRAAKASRYPTVSTFADYDHFTGTGASSDSYFVGIAASLYLFDGGRTRMSVRQAEAQVEEILASDRRTRLDIELEVRKACLQRRDARERLNVRSAAVREATENLRQTQSRYDSQSATISDVLAARVSLSNARVQVIQIQADIAIADAELERALGHLTQLLHTASTPDAP